MAEENGITTIFLTIVDDIHPLFLQPSDAPRLVLIPIKLTGHESYTLWTRSTKLALRGKGKIKFIDETCVKAKYKGELDELGEKCNAIVLSWIGSTILAEFIPSIVYALNAMNLGRV